MEIASGSAVEWMRVFADDAGDGGEIDPSEDINPEGRFIVTCDLARSFRYSDFN